MKFVSKFLFLLSLGLSLVTAQSSVKQFSFQKANSGQSLFNGDTLKILAVMVEFQADKYDATVGTGKFGSHFSQTYNDTIIDPLPHDKAYFDNHLEFAANYFSKVSKGKLNIKYYTLPDIITVSKMMREYSPAYKSTDFTPLGNLSSEVWSLAYNMYPDFNFGDYDLFIVFHAGVSNSLNTGSYDINRNLPALYLGENALKKIYGSTFEGFITKNGVSYINNSVIMPETESRETTAIDESIYLYQISINGELVSNIASYLGLPDLYNTETGLSAIGRFGLMDGQAMVANSGTYPPEPSAWEKIYLGWETPVTVSLNNSDISLYAKSAASTADTTIIKIPINDYEYYLIENRQQDAKKDGIIVTYKKDGVYFTNTLQTDSTGLYSFLESQLKGGVVVDVDEFDAALPGNGIVIWHIDEKIINSNLSSNTINNDDLNMGVAVVEADGIHDIGVVTTTVFGDVIGEGSIEDFWYLGNEAKYYKNKFSDDTKPSAKSNSGTNSLITLQNFTASSSKMSFNLSFGGAVNLKCNAKLTLSETPESFLPVKEGGNLYYYILVAENLIKYDSLGNKLKTYGYFSTYRPAYYSSNDTLFIAGAYKNEFHILNLNSGILKTFTMSNNITSIPLVRSLSGGSLEILFGDESGNIYGIKDYSLYLKDIALSGSVIQICASENSYSAFSEYGFSNSAGNVISFPYKIKQSVMTLDANGNIVNVLLAEGNHFYVVKNNAVNSEFIINESSAIERFILADIRNDGENSIVFTVDDKLYSVNSKGVIDENYPVTLTDGSYYTKDILSFYYDADKSTDFITFTDAGSVYSYNGKTGQIIKSFSLSSGSKEILCSLHSINNADNDYLGLSLLTSNSSIYTWDLLFSSSSAAWKSVYADNSNASYLPKAENTVSYSSLLVKDKVYNWPNPAYGGTTYIRFYVSEESKVNIKIFDMGGEIAAEFEKNVQADINTEIAWNVSNVSSGVYFARVEAVSSSGKSEYKFVKIAVIK